ncbi:MAG: IS21-like element helper ATPase IstB [Vicinamibacterales bacterium]|nr:IS21-like element helper ATPase IstB [Vicinamibacterales bacterium]
MTPPRPDTKAVIAALFKEFKLPTAALEMARRLEDAGHDDALDVVREVLEAEHDDRRERRVARLRHDSALPPGKTLTAFDFDRLPLPLGRKLRDLCRGDFLEEATNVLAFGLPGTGKTHAACALGHALVQAGHSVLFTPTFLLVQQLLAAKRDFDLPRALRKLDRYELLICDDIGYVKQSPDEIEVLFTLLAERYERRSMLITSNLVFSAWDRIFNNPMTTAAAIDRLVHHSVILEFDVPSYRTQAHAAASADPRPDIPA